MLNIQVLIVVFVLTDSFSYLPFKTEANYLLYSNNEKYLRKLLFCKEKNFSLIWCTFVNKTDGSSTNIAYIVTASELKASFSFI